MLKLSNLSFRPGAGMPEFVKRISQLLQLPRDQIKTVQIYKRSLDARKKGAPVFVYQFLVDVINEAAILARRNEPNIQLYRESPFRFPYVKTALSFRPVIVGSGPAGLFCALMLARCGSRPIVLERGEPVEKRSKTVEAFWAGGPLRPESNVQFGEGGAGTFSDGKLTCGKNDPRISFVLQQFVAFGAPESIRYDQKPHIGTDHLKTVVKNMREEIIRLGGEFQFSTKFTGFAQRSGNALSVQAESSTGTNEIETGAIVLALGHSARDTFQLLYDSGVTLIPKPFSVGVRIEHTRETIDRIQYKSAVLSTPLPAADYKLACHLSNGRGVYTFCMCPGGKVVASASEPGGLVTNGMSYFSRDEINSNSALLVSVTPEDFSSHHPLSGIAFQRQIEKAAFELGGKNYHAPCQLVSDFMRGTASTQPGSLLPSYRPGVRYTDLARCLPDFVTNALRDALPLLGRKMPGFYQEDALLTAPETRSSSPVRILRDESMQSVSHKNLYPCGEGAGYAGGIMSCAVDGIKCAQAILRNNGAEA